jgi:tetrathionate reductase subunit B
VMAMNKYVLLIDHPSCWGCKACEVACKQENSAPDGIKLISVRSDGPEERDGKLEFNNRVHLCRHCDNSPCAEACPVEAISQRKDGIVVLDVEACTGCAACVEACPYQAIVLDIKEGKARKCNLCVHRVDQGLIPACADNICLAHCIYFGPEAQVNQELREKDWLKERIVEDRKGK